MSFLDKFATALNDLIILKSFIYPEFNIKILRVEVLNVVV